MTIFPNSPHLMKGALVGVDSMNPLPSVGGAVQHGFPDSEARPVGAKATGNTGSEDYNSSFSWSTVNRVCLRR